MTGLVLAGGGVKGSYQVGSYLAFKKCHIKIFKYRISRKSNYNINMHR